MELGRAGPLPQRLVVWVVLATAAAALHLCVTEVQALASGVARDLDSLLKFKDKLSDPTGQLGSWQSGGNPCAFKGVTCDAGGQVVQLQLQGLSLAGSLPAVEEGELPALQVLWLQGNHFNGAVPPSFASLTALTDLRLGGWETSAAPERSQLSGSIPLAFGNLTNLQVGPK